MKEINIIDCTLRDGGYYNNWDFSNEIVNDYLESMSRIGVKNIELGFRSLQKRDFKGPNWYTTDSYIKNLKIPKNIRLGVMVNVAELITYPSGINKAIKKIFDKSKNSKIKFVRLASHFKDFKNAGKACVILKKMGYSVAINLMQITEQSEDQITIAAKIAQKIKPDILYFADSLGGMNPEDVSSLIKLFKESWKGPVGIHTHNNLGKAIANSLEAIESGATWIDCTVTGMGRGPGNAQTEYLLIELQKFRKERIKLHYLLELIKKHFEPMQNRYKWGINSYYYLAGKYGIHPTYIQEMLSIKLDETEILAAIDQLRIKGGNSYNIDLVRSEFQKPMKLVKGNWNPIRNIKGREVLFISSGPKAKEYKSEIEKYIKKNKPFVIALNTSICINIKLINLYVACNPLKLISEADLYQNIKSPLAVPKSLLPNKLKEKFKRIKLLNFGVGLKENEYKIYNNCSSIPRLYTLSYALAIATSGNAKRILLAGFDGYGANDRRNKIIDELFFLYSKNKKAKQIIAITPTSYSFKSTSIYAI